MCRVTERAISVRTAAKGGRAEDPGGSLLGSGRGQEGGLSARERERVRETLYASDRGRSSDQISGTATRGGIRGGGGLEMIDTRTG